MGFVARPSQARVFKLCPVSCASFVKKKLLSFRFYCSPGKSLFLLLGQRRPILGGMSSSAVGVIGGLSSFPLCSGYQGRELRFSFLFVQQYIRSREMKHSKVTDF